MRVARASHPVIALAALCVSVAVVAGCARTGTGPGTGIAEETSGPVATTSAPVTTPPTAASTAPSATTGLAALSITRSGGIAGVMQMIEIKPDGGWVYTDKKRLAVKTGTLTSAQRATVIRLLAVPGLAAAMAKSGPSGVCMDAFQYQVSINGEKYQLEDCGHLDPSVNALLNAITEATAF